MVDKLLVTQKKIYFGLGFVFGLWLLILSCLSAIAGEGCSIAFLVSNSPFSIWMLFDSYDLFNLGPAGHDLTERIEFLFLVFPPFLWSFFFSFLIDIKLSKKWWREKKILYLISHYLVVVLGLILIIPKEMESIKRILGRSPWLLPIFFGSYLLANISVFFFSWRLKARVEKDS